MRYGKIIIIGALLLLSQKAGAVSMFEKYAVGEPVRILIVPGHDDEYGGAVYKTTEEATMTLPVANKIRDLLNSNPHFFVTVTRTEEGYLPELVEYFKQEEEIQAFIERHKKQAQEMSTEDETDVIDGVAHNDAPSVVANRLYGINKWASENNYDIVLHLHFNDAYPREIGAQGEAEGFSIYTPGPNLNNYVYAKILSNQIGERLKKSIFTSNLPVEMAYMNDSGVIEEEKLIAIGPYGTSTATSILLEYSYIYEPMLEADTFDLSSDVLAKSTVYGITEYFSGMKLSNKNLAYEWKTQLQRNNNVKKNKDVVALQFALHELGFYPPQSDREACTIDGLFGSCTETAVKEFQKEYNLTPDGVMGAKSRTILNALF